MNQLVRALLLPLILSFPAVLTGFAGQEEECVRGEPEPLFTPNSPAVKEHSFNRKSSHEAEEEVVFKSGDILRIKNWGCEYFVNTFHYESKSIEGKDSDVSYWFQKTAEILRMMAEARPNVVFNLQKAAATLESKVSDGSELSFDHSPYRVEGDGIEFLQTQVVVKNGQPRKGRKSGFVEFELMKGPL